RPRRSCCTCLALMQRDDIVRPAANESRDMRAPALKRRQLRVVVYTPAIPPREPDTWLTHNSMMSGLTPSSAIPVTAGRRRSCSRHGASDESRARSRAAVSIAASSLRLARDQPLGGVVPVVVKTRSGWPGGMSASAIGGNSNLYGRLFLVLLPGNCHNP